MSDVVEDVPEDPDASNNPQRRTVLRSEIAFPYVNLEDTAEMAKAMQQAGDVPMTRDQLAALINVSSSQSTFKNKIGAARQFGLIAAKDSKLFLQNTGHRIVSDDEQEARIARRDAFQNVELYRQLAEHFRGKPLPPSSGIERAMRNFGVSERQTDKARQIFEKSAIFAGFMTSAKDRIVEPLIIPKQVIIAKELETPAAIPQVTQKLAQQEGAPVLSEALIQGILARMPLLGTDWPARDRVRWLRTFISILDTVYTLPENTNGDVEIDVKLIEI